MSIEFGIYRHKKTGNLYRIEHNHLINSTNAQNGQKMVMYRELVGGSEGSYVREETEFLEKFEWHGDE